MNGIIRAIYIAPRARERMLSVPQVRAIAGMGLEGDRYCEGQGSFNKGMQGRRQVTIMNTLFFKNSGFTFEESRRNLFLEGVEIMHFLGKEFQIGQARFHGVKYCVPCEEPSKLSGKVISFRQAFLDRGGILATVLTDGLIKVGDVVIPPSQKY